MDYIWEKGFKGKENVYSFSAKRNHFLGVSKRGNMWEAKIRHPKQKIEVYLGYYSTPEEAALVVKNKKAEFQKTLKGRDGLRMKRCGNEFQGRKVPSGVEAAVVADRKRAELREVCGGKVKGRDECEDDDVVLLDCVSEVTRNFGCSDKQTGVSRVRSDERVKDPASNDRILLGTCNTAEATIRSYDKKRAVQIGGDGMNNFAIVDKPNCEVVDVFDNLEREFVYGSRTSNIELGMPNSACVGDKRLIHLMSQKKAKLYSEPTGAEKALDTTASYHSPISVLDSENSSHSLVNDDPSDTMVYVPFNSNIEPGNVPNFDEAVRLGTMNEYGQLLGEFSIVDEPIWFEIR